MRTVRALLNVLEHDAREETVAQKRRLALVERQEAAKPRILNIPLARE